ncbi:MAG: pro-sigmaK processing inhibitor BofA family protein [Ruminococcus sp.]|nr:pro-sigmaK processing inhibitor BofA family protein [Ruminococcus sp.]
METETVFYAICAAAVLIMLEYFRRRRRRILSFVFGAATGLIALMLVNKFGFVIGADIPLNTFNICGSAVLGAPFVVCLVILNFL